MTAIAVGSWSMPDAVPSTEDDDESAQPEVNAED
jgi:hypothetical protein